MFWVTSFPVWLDHQSSSSCLVGKLTFTVNASPSHISMVKGASFLSPPLLLPDQNPPPHSCIPRPWIKMSLSCQKTTLLRSDEPAAKDPSVGAQDHCQLPLAGLWPRAAGEVQGPGLSHSLDQLVQILATFPSPPYITIPCKPSLPTKCSYLATSGPVCPWRVPK